MVSIRECVGGAGGAYLDHSGGRPWGGDEGEKDGM